MPIGTRRTSELRKGKNQGQTDSVTGDNSPSKIAANKEKDTTCFTELLELEKDPGNTDVTAKMDYLTRMVVMVLRVVCDVKKTMDDVQTSLTFSQGELEDLKSKVTTVESTVTNLQQEVTLLKSSNKQLQDHVIRLEAQSRRDNLILDGIPEEEGETSEDCRRKVYNIIQSNLKIADAHDIRIVRCHRLGGKKPNSARPRSMIFKLHWFGDRERIWEARKNLQGSKLWLQEDFPVQIQQRRRLLGPIAREARRKGKKATVTVDKLVIDGNTYTVDTINRLPEDLSPAKVATRSDNTVTAFYTSQSPLSNFYLREIKDKDGTKYHSSEQMYQAGKAKSFNDNVTAARIMSCKTPYECYMEGKKVQNFNLQTWKEKAPEVMYEVCLAKFSQHTDLKSFLLGTGQTVLAEASRHDTFWGVGISLQHKDIFQQNKWSGQNWMGKTLMKLRQELQ